MLFSKFSLAATLATVAYAQVPAKQAASNLDAISSLTTQVNKTAGGIEVTNYLTTAPNLLTGLNQVTRAATAAITALGGKAPTVPSVPPQMMQMEARDDAEAFVGGGAVMKRQATPPYTLPNQQTICNAFAGLVATTRATLATIIAKHTVLDGSPFETPVDQALTTLQTNEDALAVAVGKVVPSCVQALSVNKASLDAVFARAIQLYGPGITPP